MKKGLKCRSLHWSILGPVDWHYRIQCRDLKKFGQSQIVEVVYKLYSMNKNPFSFSFPKVNLQCDCTKNNWIAIHGLVVTCWWLAICFLLSISVFFVVKLAKSLWYLYLIEPSFVIGVQLLQFQLHPIVLS